jgi:hypothetical protein
MSSYRAKIQDTLLILKDAKLERTSGYATLWDGAAGTRVTVAGKVDTGGGFFKGALVIDINDFNAEGAEAFRHTSGRQLVSIQLRGCRSATFATREVVLAQWDAGIGTQATGYPSATWATLHGYLGINGRIDQRIIRPFINEVADIRYRYLRLYHQFLGTWATGINYSAFISND